MTLGRSIVPVGAVVATALVPLLPAQPAAAAVTCHGQRATIVGTAHGDVLNGTAGRDVIAGLGGNDTINGRGGNDVICGGRGADSLSGGRGNDKLYGGLDELTLNEEGEEERVGDTLRGGPGDDVLRPGTDHRDAEDIDLDTITWDTSTRGVHIDITKGVATGDGRDTFSADSTWVIGSNHDDTIDGSARADHINAGPGSDVVRGRRGDDQIVLDPNQPTGASADDVARGGQGNDDISATTGYDSIYGGPGNDGITDTGPSNDTLAGGTGNDLIIDQVGDTNDAQEISGGTGVNQLNLFTTLINPTAAPSSGTWNMASGAMQLTFDTTISFTASGFDFATFNTPGTSWDVTGTTASDDINAAGTSGTHFQGLGGDDAFFGSPSDDVFDGGDGTDTDQGMGAGDDTCISVEVSPPGDCEHSS